MNAFTLLKEDHQRVADLFEQLSETSERAKKTRDELFKKVYQELDVHSRIEEELLYPILKESEETREIATEAVEEHRIVKQLLQELNVNEKGTEQWSARLTVLKENVEHHVEEEEGEMFKKARKVLSEQQLEDLGTRMAAEKKKLAKTASRKA
jgi:hemerythrin superfamily protein